MDKFIKDKINQSISDRKKHHSRFSENCSTYSSFLELEKKAFEAGYLSRKHKELMALSFLLLLNVNPVLNGMFNRLV